MKHPSSIKSTMFAAAAMGLSAHAAAEDLPVPVPPGAAVATSGGLYVWARSPGQIAPTDGSHAIPNTLGVNGAEPVAAGENATPPGDVLGAGVGYVFPDGTFPSALGAKVRVEAGASSLQGSVAQSPGSRSMFIGSGADGTLVGGCAGCNFPVTSNYSRQQTSLKAASDYNIKGVTVTPSVTVFGSDHRQDFEPTASTLGPSTLQWNDWGAKVGLDTKVNVAPTVTLNVGGHVSVARRDTSLNASSASGAPLAGTHDASAAPIVANTEAKLTYKPIGDLELKTYGGVNSYDSKVPGLVAPSGGAAPAVKFTPETGYYAGAGMTYRFGTR